MTDIPRKVCHMNFCEPSDQAIHLLSMLRNRKWLLHTPSLKRAIGLCLVPFRSKIILWDDTVTNVITQWLPVITVMMVILILVMTIYYDGGGCVNSKGHSAMKKRKTAMSLDSNVYRSLTWADNSDLLPQELFLPLSCGIQVRPLSQSFSGSCSSIIPPASWSYSHSWSAGMRVFAFLGNGTLLGNNDWARPCWEDFELPANEECRAHDSFWLVCDLRVDQHSSTLIYSYWLEDRKHKAMRWPRSVLCNV